MASIGVAPTELASVELDQLHLDQADFPQQFNGLDNKQCTSAWSSLPESILVRIGAHLCDDDSLALAAARLTCKAWRTSFSLLVKEVVLDIRDRSVEEGGAYVRSFCAGEPALAVPCPLASPWPKHAGMLAIFIAWVDANNRVRDAAHCQARGLEHRVASLLAHTEGAPVYSFVVCSVCVLYLP